MFGIEDRGDEAGAEREQRHARHHRAADRARWIERSVVGHDPDMGGHLADRLTAGRGERTEVRQLQQQQEPNQRRGRQQCPVAHREARHPQRRVEHDEIDAEQNHVIDHAGGDAARQARDDRLKRTMRGRNMTWLDWLNRLDGDVKIGIWSRV